MGDSVWRVLRLLVAIILAALVAGSFLLAGGHLGTWLFPSIDVTPVKPAPAAPIEEAFDLSNLTVEREAILSGGPGKDRIPALVRPQTVGVSRVDFLDDDERVFAVEVAGEARAYPERLMAYHEVVNDVVGGVPIALVFCPLCDSISVFDRRVDGAALEFGVSGLLHDSNVLMYDRRDDALWSQLELRAISGPLANRTLTHLSGWSIASFDAWRDAHPDGRVATFETGVDRPYDRLPYRAYFEGGEPMFPIANASDALPPMTPVIGVFWPGGSRAYELAPSVRMIEDDLDGRPLRIAVDGDGRGVSVLEAPRDAAVVHAFWFAWFTAHPDGTLRSAP